MNAQQLIQSYQEARNQELAKDQQERHDVANEAQCILTESCHIWLNGLMDEFELGEIQIAKLHNWPHSFSIYQPFTWHGVPGKVTMYWWSDHSLDHPSLVFEFEGVQRRFVNNSYEEKMRLVLPTNGHGSFRSFFYYEPSGPVGAAELGKLLVTVQAEIDGRAELDQQNLVETRSRDIDYRTEQFNYKSTDLETNLQVCMEKYPELASEWERLYAEAKAERDLEQQQRIEREKAQEQFRAEWEEEKNRLNRAAEYHFEPCILYRIQYGAHVQGDIEESQYYTDTSYVLNDQPDQDGWYMQILRGELTRVKLPNVIRIDELICLTDADLPQEYYNDPLAKGEISSEKFPDLSVSYFIVPPEVKRLKSSTGNL
jgi:hypothetical protein